MTNQILLHSKEVWKIAYKKCRFANWCQHFSSVRKDPYVKVGNLFWGQWFRSGIRTLKDLFSNAQRGITPSKMQSTMVPLNAPLGDGRGAGTVVVAIPEHPPDYVVWSVANIAYGNPCCLGLLAFYFSIKSRDRKMVGDIAGATSYGSKACCTNGFALGLIIFIFILLIVIITQMTAAVAQQVHSLNRGGY
ncbi:hypothetical protein QTP70_025445 [Hemibagrus guttatus]|uniref:Interferon-induced transmembrane protein n=1 Tax=Hemibagrus guttatus TaxID=175788 RepID=A0AAE0QM10_9TELE|nr:hypothetical protein QTP70_025445 [Hemibagrus guttatus]